MNENETLPGPPDWRQLALELAEVTKLARDRGDCQGIHSMPIDNAIEQIEAAADPTQPPQIGPTQADYVALRGRADRLADSVAALLRGGALGKDDAVVLTDALATYEEWGS